MDRQLLTGDGVELQVLIRSGFPTVLLLHGLAGHGGEWQDVVRFLPSHVGVIVPDQRAHGASADAGAPVSRAGYVADVVAIIEQLAADQVVVVGQSMGGIVATLVADARPDLVNSLVLIEAGHGSMSPQDLDGLAGWFDTWPGYFADRAEASVFFGVAERSTPAWVDGLKESSAGLAARFDAGEMIETMRSLALRDRWSEWEGMVTPTTIVRASESALGDAEMERMLDTGPETKLVTVPDSGHDVHLDQPRRVADIISALLEDREN